MAIIPYALPPILIPQRLPILLRGIDSCPAGPYLATQVANVAVGDVAWTNPSNALFSDNVYATCVTVAQTSQQLQFTGFNCQIGLDKQIDGFLFEVEGKVLAGTDTVLARLIRGGVVSSTSRTNDWTTTEQFFSYGGSSDLMGEAGILPAEINLSNFGVSVRMESGLTATLSCDSCRVTIYCSTPSTVLQSSSSPWLNRGQWAPLIAQ